MCEKFIYYFIVMRESYEKNGIVYEGWIMKLIESGKLLDDIGMFELDIENDRFMLCGNDNML